MPSRLIPLRPLRSLPVRTRASDITPICLRAGSRRCMTEDRKPLPEKEDDKPDATMEQTPPHVSEEAAELAKVTGETGPDLDQGTPVQEILNKDEEVKKNAPKVLKETSKEFPNGTRSYSTSARRMQEELIRYEDDVAMDPSHKFGLPAIPLGPHDHMKYRYDTVVKQVTSLLMKDGELSKAQTNMARILNHLRTSPPPKVDPKRPLLPGAPPSQHLPLNPILYLQLAIDSVAPLLRIRSQKGFAGGGAALQVPVPLALKQRRRTAVMWILDTISKKTSKGSGKGMFAQKFADELIAVVEGRSSVWEKRLGVHRLGTSARSNLAKTQRRGGR